MKKVLIIFFLSVALPFSMPAMETRETRASWVSTLVSSCVYAVKKVCPTLPSFFSKVPVPHVVWPVTTVLSAASIWGAWKKRTAISAWALRLFCKKRNVPERYEQAAADAEPIDAAQHIEAVRIPDGGRVAVVGDLHGSKSSYDRIITDLKARGYFADQKNQQLRPRNYLVTLGDIAGGGTERESKSIFSALARLKHNNQGQVLSIRGNIDDDFSPESVATMPYAVLLGADHSLGAGNYFHVLHCSHGGLMRQTRSEQLHFAQLFSEKAAQQISPEQAFDLSHMDFYGNSNKVEISQIDNPVMSLALARQTLQAHEAGQTVDCERYCVPVTCVGCLRGHQHQPGVNVLKSDGDYHNAFTRLDADKEIELIPEERHIFTTVASRFLPSNPPAGLVSYAELVNRGGHWFMTPRQIEAGTAL